jgi:MATE family multidrug resistance protein
VSTLRPLRLSFASPARPDPLSLPVAAPAAPAPDEYGLVAGLLEGVEEFKQLLRRGYPVMLTSSLSALLSLVDIVFVGRWLGPQLLAAAAVGAAFFNVVYVLLAGVSNAVDKSCTEAVRTADGTGTGTGPILQRGLLVCLLLVAPAMAALALADPLLQSVFLQTPALSRQAAAFCSSLILGLLPWAAFLCASRWLSAQHVVMPPIVISGIANVANVFANAALISVDGFLGSPLATSVCRLLELLLLVAYVYRWRPLKARGDWKGWRALREVVGSSKEMGKMLGVSLVSAALVALEGWPYEITSFMAARLPQGATGAHAVCLYLSSFLFLGLPLGVAVAGSNRVAEKLAAGNGRGAHLTVVVTAVTGIVFMFTCACLTLAGRQYVAALFTSAPEVSTEVARVALLAALYQTVDGFQGCLGGVLRGVSSAYDKIITTINGISWWIIGLPLAFYFASGRNPSQGLQSSPVGVHSNITHSIEDVELVEFGLISRFSSMFPSHEGLPSGIYGLWLGMFAAVSCNAVCFTVLYKRCDWQKLAAKP